jgi:hypothetical protein
MKYTYDLLRKFLSVCVVVFSVFAAASVSEATPIEAFLYEISIAGTFGTAIDPIHSNLPDSPYPFPMMRGGSFDGLFVYDSWAALDGGRFPYVSVDINVRDNSGAIVQTINTSPNNFFVTPTLLQLTFGPSSGIPDSIQDLRLELNGAFTVALPSPPPGMSDWGLLSVHVVPPPPSEIVSGVLNFGFLETDGTRPFTFWDLPVSAVSLSHTGTTSYIREVPEPGSTILLFLSFFGLFIARLYQHLCHQGQSRTRAMGWQGEHGEGTSQI